MGTLLIMISTSIYIDSCFFCEGRGFFIFLEEKSVSAYKASLISRFLLEFNYNFDHNVGLLCRTDLLIL